MKKTLGVIIAVALVFVGANSSAEIVGYTGDVKVIEPPSSVQRHQLESDTEIRAFGEQQNLELDRDVSANITQPGTYDSEDDLTPGLIPAGTCVNSYFLHSDTVRDEDVSYEGSITFNSPILGVILLDNDLSNTDGIVGLPDTQYPTDPSNPRGYELSRVESIQVSEDMKSLTVLAHTGLWQDQLRVITERCDSAESTFGEEGDGGCGCAVLGTTEVAQPAQIILSGLLYLLPFAFVGIQLRRFRSKR